MTESNLRGGIFAVYKPKGLTSNEVLENIRRVLRRRVKVGHAGTLDPLAEGILVVGIGREYTKKLKKIVGQEKEYQATIRLGMVSTTDDREGEKKEIEVIKPPSLAEVQKAVSRFVGKIEQVPPLYSAVKVRGREAYKRVRRGEKIILEPRSVWVKSIEILDYRYPFLKLRLICGPGFYVRALARDLGKKLGTGGLLWDLKRTRVGEFRRPLSLEEFLRNIQKES